MALFQRKMKRAMADRKAIHAMPGDEDLTKVAGGVLFFMAA